MAHKNWKRPSNKGQFKYKSDWEDPIERKSKRSKQNQKKRDHFESEVEYLETQRF